MEGLKTPTICVTVVVNWIMVDEPRLVPSIGAINGEFAVELEHIGPPVLSSNVAGGEVKAVRLNILGPTRD